MAIPELTYGGFPLATDVDQGIASFMDRDQSLEDLRDIAPSIGRIGSRADGLAWPNYPARPKIRPNQLYWPTGASRWAIGYFFADDAAKDKIVAAAHPGSSTNTALELRVVQNETFAADLFLLTPRKVTSVDDENNLWLLPLVDERYFWQFRDNGPFEVTPVSTWLGLFNLTASRLGVTIDADEVPSAYLIPDPEQMTRPKENAAAYLDAVAHSVGQRIVRWPDGTIKSMAWATSQDQLTDNIETKTPWQQLAGGEFDYGPVPASVDVNYRRFVDHVFIPDRAVILYSEPAASHLDSPTTTNGTIKTIQSTAYAEYTTNGSGTPDNDAVLDPLASEIASDYYDSLLHTYDRTFAGIKLWDSCGYDDHILYQFGGEYPVKIDNDDPSEPDGEYEIWAHTRVQSMPINSETENQLSQDDTIRVLSPQQFGIFSDPLTIGNNPATFDVWKNTSVFNRANGENDVTDPLITVEVYRFHDVPIAAGTDASIYFNYESERWYADPHIGGESGGSGIFQGTVQAGTGGGGASAWTNTAGGVDGYDTVEVWQNGLDPDPEDAVTVRLPHVGIDGDRKGPVPNLRAGNILAYTYVTTGGATYAVCVSGYLDDALGTIKMWTGTLATIPFGWERFDSLDGKIPVGVDVDENFTSPWIRSVDTAALKASGQEPTSWTHNEDDPPDDWSHDDHILDSEVAAPGSGSGFFGNSDNDLEHSEALHAPPMWTVFFIIRIHE